MSFLQRKITAALTVIFALACFSVFAITRTSIATGNWSNSSIWSPAGNLSSSDNMIIASGTIVTVDTNCIVNQVTVNSGGLLTFNAGKNLTINGKFTINGTVQMNGGDIGFPIINTFFILGANSSFTWEPATNTAAGASLFVNGTESFDPTSTLIIKKWYNYTTLPLGSVVTGNFGNLIINTNSSGTILEWNQNNQFQTHRILGTLTVDQGWVTLDKSGSISNTTIGNIILKTVNSYFTAYSGTASPDFTLNTASVTNNGGTFFGVFDGKGNITLNVSGNITNTGNIKLIDNDGLMGSGLCNGNATLNVAGAFSQSSGDTRFIYNLFSTTAGIFNASIGTVNLTGGILVGHYSCHTGGATSSFNIINSCILNMPNATDKFRCVGLSNLSTTVNNVKSNFTVGGDLIISGNAVAEFTSDASSGDETDSIKGNFVVSSCVNSFNYGSAVAAHNALVVIGDSMKVSGGLNYLSRLPGKLTATINGGLIITNGNLVVKSDIGTATLMVNGTFNQSGGKLFHHSNYSTPTSDVVNVVMNGDFNQSAGTISFDDCSSSTASHSLNMNGNNYNLSGTGTITRTGSASFENIFFGKQGTIEFNRTGYYHSILQTKQYINNGCTLTVNSGDLQLCSSDSSGNYFLEILSGGALSMNSFQVFSNATGANCAIKVDSGATFKTGRAQGLYDGTTSACITAASNMQFYLDANSTVEYNGNINQVLTGIGAGTAVSSNQKYGILRINMNGSNGANSDYPVASNVYIRTQLNLANGELNLNGQELIIESGLPGAIIRTNGYIKSETDAAFNPSILTWKNLSAGSHVFPFGVNTSGYIPVTFTPVAGMGGNVSVSTRATSSSDNSPLPTVSPTNLAGITADSTMMGQRAIDRWWAITANGFTASVTLSYLGSENTMNDSCATTLLTLDQSDGTGTEWAMAPTANAGVTSGVGIATVNNTTIFSNWVLVGQPIPLPTIQPLDTSEASADDLVIQSLGPNPFTTQFNISYDLYQNGPVTIQIADQNGKVLFTQVVNGVAGSNSFAFSEGSSLTPAIYFFYMTYHGTTTTRKIVKN